MLVCSDLKKTYMRKTAVENISLTLEKGKIYALLGPNGSGKTTFMKMAAGLVKPTEGSILYDDKPIGVESKKHIAYMSTEPYFYSFMTVEAVGKYYKDFFDDFDEEKYKKLIQEMELDMADKASKLSSGMAAKLKIAVTLSRKAELYLLDEPLNGIDLLARERIITTILNAAGNDCAVVISSHLVEELEPVVDSVIFIKDGRNVLQGDAESIREQQGKSIVELYKEIYSRG
jgi:ABC-2 type transport system ATP-binding protein